MAGFYHDAVKAPRLLPICAALLVLCAGCTSASVDPMPASAAPARNAASAALLPATTSALPSFDAAAYEELLAQLKGTPAVVNIWASWCGPCRAVAPVLEREVESRDGAAVLAKVDVDANQTLANEYGVRGIPAVKGFRDGRVVAEFVGAQSPVAISSFLDELLAPPRIDGEVEELRASGKLPDVLAALEADDPERALELILDAVPQADTEERDRLRELAVSIFDDLGHDDPRTAAYRRRLATALY